MDVLEFLEAERTRPFIWGETDCATTADRWFVISRGFSAMGRYGRLVTDEANGRAWLASFGGFIRSIHDIMDIAGVAQLHGAPAPGDIATVIVENRACVAIFDGSLWRSRDEDGFIATDDSHRHFAWEVSVCRSL